MLKKLISKIIASQTKTISDDLFINRLRCSVIGEGMLHDGNIYLMDYAIKNLPIEGVIVEIGSYGGLSANLILYLLQKYSVQKELFCCDPWIYEGYEDYKGIQSETMDGRLEVKRIDYMNYVVESFKNSVQLLNPQNLPFSFRVTSNDFFTNWNHRAIETDVFGREKQLGGTISFAYIDGDHSYDQAKKDFDNVNNLLVKGGYILLDDSGNGMPFGSAIMMKEIKNNPDYEVVMVNPNYLLRKR